MVIEQLVSSDWLHSSLTYTGLGKKNVVGTIFSRASKNFAIVCKIFPRMSQCAAEHTSINHTETQSLENVI